MLYSVTQIVVVFVVICALVGCDHTPILIPRLILHEEPVGDSFWLAAPYIAVVKIVRADLLGSPEPIFPGGSKSLQLVRFTAGVENVIKGDLSDKMIVFFFFMKIDQNPHYYLDPGKRYIVSLRKENGVFRSFADATQLRIWVHSGRHRQEDLPLQGGPEVTIAYIALTPGADYDLQDFRTFLGWPPYGGDPGYVNERLTQLQQGPDQALRDIACLTSASIFWHHPKCLERALRSPDPRTRRSAEGYFKEGDEYLLEPLRKNPFSLFSKHCTNYMSQMFEIYAEDSRPEVRNAACGYLRIVAPGRTIEACR